MKNIGEKYWKIQDKWWKNKTQEHKEPEKIIEDKHVENIPEIKDSGFNLNLGTETDDNFETF